MTSTEMVSRVRTYLNESGFPKNIYAFNVSGVINFPTIGSIYSNNSKSFYVTNVNQDTIITDSGVITCESDGTPTSSGTLSLVFGSGDSAITFGSVSTLLSGFWDDTEIYSALTDGQREVLQFVLNIFSSKQMINPSVEIPRVIYPLLKSASLTLSSYQAALPSDYIYDLYISSQSYRAYKRLQRRTTNSESTNSFLKPSSSDNVYYIQGNNLIVESGGTLLANSTLTLVYISEPPKITSTQNSLLTADTHNSIVLYAYAVLLQKDNRVTEALALFNRFLLTIKEMVY